jgi:hypothetical protein
MNNLETAAFEYAGAATLVKALVELYRPKAEASASAAIHATDNLPAGFDCVKFAESCGEGLELTYFALFLAKGKELGSPTHVPIAIAGVYKRTDNINDFIKKETKAFLENIPKEWGEYWLRAFSERLKGFLDEIDNADDGESA